MTSWGPARVLQTAGRITGLELVRCTSVFDAEGRFAPAFDTAITETVEADQVILAVGQGVDLSYVGSALEIERGRIEVDPSTQATPLPGVFAGGDLMGPGTVIEAIAAGRRAALGIIAYLGHDGDYLAEEAGIAAEEPFLRMDSVSLEQTDSSKMPQRPVPERSLDMEDALGLTQDEIEAEADRCLNCGCVAVCPSDIAPVLVALDAKVKTTKRTIDAEDFFAAGIRSSTVLDHDELVVEIRLPASPPGFEQTYSKFRLRQSIDFPIVSVAAALNVASGYVDDVRLVLGAVAPVPMRARAVEDFLRGKAINGAIADEAAEIAVMTALPLGRNAYKVQITRVLVKRALLSLNKR
jgi:CO/xanthine dehydrogenase FAD-binding subunit